MTKVVIIGASAAGHTAAVALREKHTGCEIVLVTEEDVPFYDKRLLIDFLAGRINESRLMGANEAFYNQQGITFLKEKEASALNPEKRRLFIKDDAPIDYDLLAVCSGSNFVLPDVPGIKKRGVFRLYSLRDAKEFLSYLINAPVCVVGSSSLAIAVAESIASKQEEVKLIVSSGANPSLDDAHFVETHEDRAIGTLEVIHSEITEIIGDGETQAIRIKTGKIIGACAVIFMDRTRGNSAFLKTSNIELYHDRICVDDSFRTNLACVYAAGSVCAQKQTEGHPKTWDEAAQEGYALAGSLQRAIGE